MAQRGQSVPRVSSRQLIQRGDTTNPPRPLLIRGSVGSLPRATRCVAGAVLQAVQAGLMRRTPAGTRPDHRSAIRGPASAFLDVS
jgi:hypothetical protein